MEAYLLLTSYPFDGPTTTIGRLHRLHTTLAQLEVCLAAAAAAPEPVESVRKLIEEMEAPLRVFARMARREAHRPECEDGVVHSALSALKRGHMLIVWPEGTCNTVYASWGQITSMMAGHAVELPPAPFVKELVREDASGLRVYVNTSDTQLSRKLNPPASRLVYPGGERDIRGAAVFAWSGDVQKY